MNIMKVIFHFVFNLIRKFLSETRHGFLTKYKPTSKNNFYSPISIIVAMCEKLLT